MFLKIVSFEEITIQSKIKEHGYDNYLKYAIKQFYVINKKGNFDFQFCEIKIHILEFIIIRDQFNFEMLKLVVKI